MFMKTGAIRPHSASPVGKTALLNGMKSLVKGAAQLYEFIAIGIISLVSANHVKQHVLRIGMRNPARDAVSP